MDFLYLIVSVILGMFGFFFGFSVGLNVQKKMFLDFCNAVSRGIESNNNIDSISKDIAKQTIGILKEKVDLKWTATNKAR